MYPTNTNYYSPREASAYYEQANNLRATSIFAKLNYDREEVRAKARILIADKNKNNNDDKLTQSDRAAWWAFIQENYPDNYELALIHDGRKTDPNLDDICNPSEIRINDYFALYNLPKIKASNRKITVDDKVVSEYIDDETYVRLRNTFKLVHYDKAYHAWKRHQLIDCQQGRCAWCERRVKIKDTQVDHIVPLLYGGDNRSGNLLVACEDCNQAKCAATTGWNEERDESKPNSRPSWIKYNNMWSALGKAMAKAEYRVRHEEKA